MRKECPEGYANRGNRKKSFKGLDQRLTVFLVEDEV